LVGEDDWLDQEWSIGIFARLCWCIDVLLA
jgi:hypothetical protein